MAIWLTSDTHYGHTAVLEYCARPFSCVEEMNEALVANYNAVVENDDTVYFLGDFALTNNRERIAFGQQLKGKKILLRGNHDDRPGRMRKCGFEEVHDSLLLDTRKGTILLSHYPYYFDDPKAETRIRAVRNEIDNGLWLFHGHVHEKWRVNGRQINVGVDQWNFAPVSLETLLRLVN